MSLFRSDPMGYFSIAMARDSAWDVLNELGELNAIQFTDLNSEQVVFNRPYSNYIQRCGEVENKVSSIDLLLKRFKKVIEKCEDPKIFIRHLKNYLERRTRAEHTFLEDVEAEMEEKLASLNDQIKTFDNLTEKYNHLVEYKQVLLKTKNLVGQK
jgi:V-type H+-transporting ATPase subunit a